MISYNDIQNIVDDIEFRLSLPLHTKADNEVSKAMHSYFAKYKQLLKDTKLDVTTVNMISQQCDLINEAFLYYTKGLIASSIECIKKLMSIKFGDRKLIDYLSIRINPNETSTDQYEIIRNELRSLFRARLGSNFQYMPFEIFHIPFSERQKVRSQRFSISGLPCLYLGSSSLLCWEELNRPNYSSFHVSRFQLVNECSILNLAYDISEIDSLLNNKKYSFDFRFDWVTRFLFIFPLLVACSIVVDGSEERNFKSEYIIPQLLMLAVREDKDTKIDGIRYLSNQRKIRSSESLWRNYAFLPQGNDFRSDFSDRLLKLFLLHYP